MHPDEYWHAVRIVIERLQSALESTEPLDVVVDHDVMQAAADLRAVSLRVRGVACDRCGGYGETIGTAPAGMLAMRQCPRCGGRGRSND